MTHPALQGRIAVVTGASRLGGIGAAICRRLARDGADIFFTHWGAYDASVNGCGEERDYPEKLAEELRAFGVRAVHRAAEMSLTDAPAAIMNAAEQELGTPTILINNATHCESVGYKEITAAILDQHHAVNVRGTIMLSMEFARRFERVHAGRAPGRIISLISSGDDPNNLAYLTTKGAIAAWTEPAAASLAPLGITVNAIDPGPTDTGWMTPAFKLQLQAMFPMGRIGQPEDAAKLIGFLASDDAQWITGQRIASNGGFPSPL